MKTAILFGALLFGWIILSQLIAWMITPSNPGETVRGKDEDAVLENWRMVFMMPAVLLMVGVMVMESYWRRLARKFGFPEDVFGLLD